ncbi:MAG: SDR family oxidoreductase [Deltaproteobacteria bacterium]|jgi:UDP-N-acetylglucosamine 4-epimerase|nr:SDR family oxidoreductase [Deltaproteobacteria bacterium]
MTAYAELLETLPEKQETWLVTGVAGFIGSHLAETLLRLGQKVRGLDNFATGDKKNLVDMLAKAGPGRQADFEFMEGDVRSRQTCRDACASVDYVLHQAALGSVPRSLENPLASNETNINGFLNMLDAARADNIRSFVYASSSSVYGDSPDLPKREARTGNPLSPYAVTKAANELYARVFALNYGFRSIGLRYFNVFGERQNPRGPYAAVIPQWFAAALLGGNIYINGDGKTSRDFCFIENCVQANLLAARAATPEAWNRVYNVAAGRNTSLNQLCAMIRREAAAVLPPDHPAGQSSVIHRDFRPGDMRHSLADISLAKRFLGYAPEYALEQGLARCSRWYAEQGNR